MKRLLIKIIPKWLKNSAVKDYLFFKIIVDEFNKWQPPIGSDEDYGILTNLIIMLLWFLKGSIYLGFFVTVTAFIIIILMIRLDLPFQKKKFDTNFKRGGLSCRLPRFSYVRSSTSSSS